MADLMIRTRLVVWQRTMQEMEAQDRALHALTWAASDSPLCRAIADMQSRYTDAVADNIGCSRDWLTNWWLQDDFGKKPMRIQLKGDRWRTIKTVDGLAGIIARDMKAYEEATA